MKDKTYKISIAALFALAAADIFYYQPNYNATKEAGQDYLLDQGFKAVSGGDDYYFWGGCPFGHTGRDFIVSRDIEGEQKSARVCFSGSGFGYPNIRLHTIL